MEAILHFGLGFICASRQRYDNDIIRQCAFNRAHERRQNRRYRVDHRRHCKRPHDLIDFVPGRVQIVNWISLGVEVLGEGEWVLVVPLVGVIGPESADGVVVVSGAVVVEAEGLGRTALRRRGSCLAWNPWS